MFRYDQGSAEHPYLLSMKIQQSSTDYHNRFSDCIKMVFLRKKILDHAHKKSLNKIAEALEVYSLLLLQSCCSTIF